MTAIAAIAPARINVGWVVSATFRVMWRRWLDLLIIGAPFIVLPQVLVALLPPELSAVRLATGLPGLVFIGGASLIAYGELTPGRRVSLGEAFRKGTGKFGSLWGVGLISNIATALGLVALIVPGVIVAVGWMAASTVVMVEDKAATDSLTRSWDLSRGSRWRLAGILGLAILGLVGILFVIVVAFLLLSFAIGEERGAALNNFALTPIWALAFMSLTTVGSAATYVALRIAKEGSANDVSAVFA